MIEYKVESWAYGTCHYFEDEFVSVAINHYNKWKNAEFGRLESCRNLCD